MKKLKQIKKESLIGSLLAITYVIIASFFGPEAEEPASRIYTCSPLLLVISLIFFQEPLSENLKELKEWYWWISFMFIFIFSLIAGSLGEAAVKNPEVLKGEWVEVYAPIVYLSLALLFLFGDACFSRLEARYDKERKEVLEKLRKRNRGVRSVKKVHGFWKANHKMGTTAFFTKSLDYSTEWYMLKESKIKFGYLMIVCTNEKVVFWRKNLKYTTQKTYNGTFKIWRGLLRLDSEDGLTKLWSRDLKSVTKFTRNVFYHKGEVRIGTLAGNNVIEFKETSENTGTRINADK